MKCREMTKRYKCKVINQDQHHARTYVWVFLLDSAAKLLVLQRESGQVGDLHLRSRVTVAVQSCADDVKNQRQTSHTCFDKIFADRDQSPITAVV